MATKPSKTARSSCTQNDAFAEYREKYPPLLTIAQTEEVTGLSRRTLWRLNDAGDLTIYRVGRTRAYRLRLDDVLGLLKPVA